MTFDESSDVDNGLFRTLYAHLVSRRHVVSYCASSRGNDTKHVIILTMRQRRGGGGCMGKDDSLKTLV